MQVDLTEKRRVHEIARDEGLPSSLVLQRLQRAGLPIKTASSTVTVGEALHLLNPNRYPKPDTLDATLAAAAEAKAAPPKKKAKAAEAEEPAAEPKPKRTRKTAPAADSGDPGGGTRRGGPRRDATGRGRGARRAGPRLRPPSRRPHPSRSPRRSRKSPRPRRPSPSPSPAGCAGRRGASGRSPRRRGGTGRAPTAAAEPEAIEAVETPEKPAGRKVVPPTAAAPATPAAPSGARAAPAAAAARRARPGSRAPSTNGGAETPAVGGRRGAGAAPSDFRDSGVGGGGGGGGGRGKRRRVVIDAQASRRGPGPQGRDRRGPKSSRTEEREPAPTIAPADMPQVDIRSGATIKEMAEALGITATRIITTLMGMGEMATITQSLSDEEIELVAAELERKIQIVHAEEEDEFAELVEDSPESLVARAPVVTVMGHVDHGKTSLLDAIRQTEVVAGEAGGITQHIGAYQVHHHNRELTFLDTPGHEAFTAMRARGAKITDVAVIVVAADDGVMETTLEAIDHARAADVPFMVAINKIDKPNANPDRVRQELSTHDVIPTSWGGTYEFVEVSALEKMGLDTLLETVLLVADADADPKANADASASGSVIESRLDPGRGPVCTLLVQRGTLRVGDVLLVGQTFGRVRAMHDFKGDVLTEAGPSVPVEVLGMDGVPDAGERFRTVENERVARQLAAQRSHRIRSEELANRRPVSLEDLFARVQEGLKELNIIIKADVHGSVEALRDALENLEQTEVRLRVIHTGVGAVTESDVNLAAASEAIIIAFNVRPRPEARMLAEREGVDVRTYRVIYRAIEDMRDALIGMLTPDIVEQPLGTLEVRETFRASRIGTIAGCYVTDGVARRGASMRLVRDGTVVFEGKIGSLRRFNDDVREVAQGFECGVVIEGFNDVKEGDVIEAFELKEVARTEQAPSPEPAS